MSSIEDEELRRRKEVKSLRRIISTYLNYPEAAEEDIKRYERCFGRLPLSHKALLSHLPLKFQKLRWCVSQNSYFISEMLKAFDPPVDMTMTVDIDGSEDQATAGNAPVKQLSSSKMNLHTSKSGSNSAMLQNAKVDELSSGEGETYEAPKSEAINEVRCIVRYIVRDWAAEGQRERDECYTPILQELDRLFPHRSGDSPPACLVPGAGLGRLALEISCLGFISQGIELSYYMRICSSFILNSSQIAEEWKIYPWIHSNCNWLSDEDQLLPVSIPDIHPASAGITEGFSMCGGDFVEVYNDPSEVGAWDAVVTCFFLDTAHNVVEYIEIISKILKDGGVWINFCPLLYYFADVHNQEDEMSIELSLEDVKRVAFHYGFEMEKESTVSTTYAINRRSMMQNRYYAAFWTMRKKPPTPKSAEDAVESSVHKM